MLHVPEAQEKDKDAGQCPEHDMDVEGEMGTSGRPASPLLPSRHYFDAFPASLPGSHWCAERGQSGRHLRGGINQVVGPRHEETSAHHWSLVKPLCLQYRLSAFGILSNYDGLRTVLPIPKSLFHFGCYPG